MYFVMRSMIFIKFIIHRLNHWINLNQSEKTNFFFMYNIFLQNKYVYKQVKTDHFSTHLRVMVYEKE
jgi:hypothetical protein